MKLIFALFSIFLLLPINPRAMEKKIDANSSYIIHTNAVSPEDLLWAYQTLYPDDWQTVLDEHFFRNFLEVHKELIEYQENISKAVDLMPDQKEIGMRACDIILLVFPI